MDKLVIVVPCYNEQEVLGTTIRALLKVLQELVEKGSIQEGSRLLFVDDGSRDRTWEIIERAHAENDRICGLKLAGNVGHQFALTAGLLEARKQGDIILSIDADLQDDIGVIGEMVDKYHSGADIVYGVRSDRKSDSFFKRTSAQCFYRVLSAMGVKTVYNHADFRLMSKRAVEEFARYRESNLYLRGMMPLLGYPSDTVYYERKERQAGESKYPLKKMLALAFNGITSFSIRPISLIIFLGGAIILCCVLAACYALISYATGHVVRGWTSLILSIWFLGGVQLLSIGLIGQYIGKIYMEVKHRPRYHIEKQLYGGENTDGVS